MATFNVIRALVEVLILINIILIGLSEQRARLMKTTAMNMRGTSNPINKTVVPINQEVTPAILNYKCAQHCSCSLIQVISSNKLQTRANLTKVMCASAQFSDVLTIDRRTQIIHISLPAGQQQDEPGYQNNNNNNNNQLAGSSDSMDVSEQQDQVKFRMARLAQFNQLREIVIDNLKFELCDSEVFKKGQRLRRLQWNRNQLKHISKACFRHLNHLVDLNLDYNQLSELESALFSNLLQLKSLSIAHNQLGELAAHQFANLTQLMSLNLVGNSFKVINLHLLEPMQNSLRLLLLASNQIKSFTYTIIQPINLTSNKTTSMIQSNLTSKQTQTTINNLNVLSNTMSGNSNVFGGAIFKNLIKLNVDQNKFERIKLLQLHRFYNVKYLSIRANLINSIRDKAFNGLKLVELNLASNQLQLISKCAFCNSTIKRLVLSSNNITIPMVGSPLATGSAGSAGGGPTGGGPGPGQLFQVAGASPLGGPDLSATNVAALTASATSGVGPEMSPSTPLPPPLPPASSASMLILSQSILGPLFSQLEYLDLSYNLHLADQLEFLLEPLLELKYLNLASVGLERSLPSPSLFKNLRHLKYLNLSNNQLDQLISDTIEPLTELEVFDLSRNKFSELDESFLVTMDDLTQLKLVAFASNPWYCSQCKISPLYDWILRSPIYNATCIAPITMGGPSSGSLTTTTSYDGGTGGKNNDQEDLSNFSDDNESTLATNQHNSRYNLARGPQDYGLLTLADELPGGSNLGAANNNNVDFDLILLAANENDDLNYQFMTSTTNNNNNKLTINQNNKRKQLARLIKSLETDQDDQSIRRTISSISVASKIIATNQESTSYASSSSSSSSAQGNEYLISPSELLLRSFNLPNFCLKCEFPSELKTFNVHELSPGDFKYCAGFAPRSLASEPKIGLTLAIVIIGALFCIIIIVIVIYRKKSNAYYPNELDITERLDGGAGSLAGGSSAKRAGQPVLSVSSDNEHQYGDGTDYSSPPLSQSYESFSGNEDNNDDDDEELDEEEDEDDYDDDDDDDDDEEDEDEDEDEEEEDEREHGDYDDEDDDDVDDNQLHHLDEVKEADEAAENDEHQDRLINSNSNANANNSGKVQANNKTLTINNQQVVGGDERASSAEKSLASSSQPALKQTTANVPIKMEQRQGSSSGGGGDGGAGEASGARKSGEPQAGSDLHQSIGTQSGQVTENRLASLSASDLQAERHLSDLSLEQQSPNNGHAPKLVQLANVAGSLHGSQSRARTRQERGGRARHPQQHEQQSSLPPRQSSEQSSSPAATTGTSKLATSARHKAPAATTMHRQSSEHSTAGSVSFAASPPTNSTAGSQRQQPLNSSSSHSTSSAARQRRDRLVQGSQTIAGAGADHQRRLNNNHDHQVATGGSMESSTTKPARRPAANLTTTTGSSSTSPSNKAQLIRPARRVGGQQRQVAAVSQSPARSESRAATLSTPSQTAATRRVVHMADELAGAEFPFQANPSRQAALRGIPGRRPQEGGSRESSADDQTTAGDDSLALEAQLADLPSDLDETDVENMLASNAGAYLDAGHHHHHHQRHDDDDDDDDDEYDAHGHLSSGQPGAIHESHSTHSALTQTGSRDFQPD